MVKKLQSPAFSFSPFGKNSPTPVYEYIFVFVMSAVSGIVSYFLLKFYDWARKLLIILYGVGVIVAIIFTLPPFADIKYEKIANFQQKVMENRDNALKSYGIDPKDEKIQQQMAQSDENLKKVMEQSLQMQKSILRYQPVAAHGLWFLIVGFYLTRPKVKEHFKA